MLEKSIFKHSLTYPELISREWQFVERWVLVCIGVLKNMRLQPAFDCKLRMQFYVLDVFFQLSICFENKISATITLCKFKPTRFITSAKHCNRNQHWIHQVFQHVPTCNLRAQLKSGEMHLSNMSKPWSYRAAHRRWPTTCHWIKPLGDGDKLYNTDEVDGPGETRWNMRSSKGIRANATGSFLKRKILVPGRLPASGHIGHFWAWKQFSFSTNVSCFVYFCILFVCIFDIFFRLSLRVEGWEAEVFRCRPVEEPAKRRLPTSRPNEALPQVHCWGIEGAFYDIARPRSLRSLDHFQFQPRLVLHISASELHQSVILPRLQPLEDLQRLTSEISMRLNHLICLETFRHPHKTRVAFITIWWCWGKHW